MKKFKTESKRLLDLMINSIYTNREIFLRELISNASDALDKRHFLSLTDSKYSYKELEGITITPDLQARTLTIEDDGIGMTIDELEENLGTIAHSGSKAFKEQLEDNKEVDIIGQFGVGFYSAFMVADRIVVESKKIGEEAAKWESNGQDGYTVEKCDKEESGTKITLFLREDSEDINYSDYLDKYTLEQLVKKYSNYVRYPIKMVKETSIPDESEEGKYKTVENLATLNERVPIWRKKKADVTEEEYNKFYKSQYYDVEDPIETIHYRIEGNVNYRGLLFIPGKVPFNYYSKDFEAGLQLYTKNIFIQAKCKELLPDYFYFVRGVVDCDDISLNISRELLQQSTELQSLSKSVTKKVKSTLVNMLVKEREKYEKFFTNFGYSLKYGCYSDYGMHKEELQDLLLFHSSFEDKYVTLKEYVERMKEGQKEIYYATGRNIESIKKLPQIEQLLEKGFEVLFFTDDIDEFVVMMMRDYDSKPFQSAQKANADLDSEEDKKQKQQLSEENKDLLSAMQKALEENVKEVRISSRLKTHPVCLVADEGLSLEMEKYLSQLPDANENVKATRILEINPDHEIFKVMQKVFEKDPDSINDYADILYKQALLIEGFTIDDPVEYSNKICSLIAKANS